MKKPYLSFILFACFAASGAASAKSSAPNGFRSVITEAEYSVQDTTKSKRSSKQVEIVSKNRENKGNFIYINNGTHEEIKYNGAVTLSKDFKDVKSISPGGYLRYEKKMNGVARKLEIESDKSGNLTRKYYEEGKQVAYEPAGKQWLQQVMPEIIIKTGIGLETILQDAYKKNGAKGVLAEADKTTSDGNKVKIIKYLLEQPDLRADDVKLALEYAGKNANSDYELSKLLRQIPASYLAKNEVATAYLEAIRKISSDYEMQKALSHLLTVENLSKDATALALEAVNTVSSDYEKSKIVQQLASQKNFMSNSYKGAFAAIDAIGSDYEKSKLISSILKKQDLSEAQYRALFPVVGRISSDYEKSKVLRSIAPRIPASATALREDYRKVAKTISSDYEYQKALGALN